MAGEEEKPHYIETKAGPVFVQGGKAQLRDRAGNISETDPSTVDQVLGGEGGNYLPATATDVEAFDKKVKGSSLSSRAAALAESAVASGIGAAQAPLRAPVALGAALLGKEDPLAGLGGRETLENLATITGNIKEKYFGGKTGEAFGREYGEEARERAEAHPEEAFAGSVLGSLAAGGGLAGGARALGKGVAGALGEGIGAKAAGALASGATEGAAYGQAQASEEAYLHNVPLSAEKLIASMGWGAVLGGGVSLAAHGPGALLRKGSRGATPVDSPRLPGELAEGAEAAATRAEAAAAGAEAGALDAGIPTIKEAAEGAAKGRIAEGLREFADARTMKALGANASVIKRLGRNFEQAKETMRNVARAVRDVTLDDGSKVFRALDSQEQLAERVALARQQAGEKLGAFREKAAEVFEAHPAIAPKADAIADRIEKEIVSSLESHPLSATRAQAAPIRNVVDDLRALSANQWETVGSGKRKLVTQTKAPGVQIEELTRLRDGLDDQIYQAKKGVNLTQQGAAPNLKDLERARMILEESIEAASDKAATFFEKGEAQSYRQLKTQYRNLKLASDIAGEAELRDLGNRVVSPSDYGAGIIGSAMGGGPVGAIASTMAHKAIREHSSAVLSVLADKLAASLDGKIESGLGAFFKEATQRGSPGLAGLEKAAQAVPLKRLATPTAVEAFQGKSKDLQSAYKKRLTELTDATREGGAGARAATMAAMGGAAQLMPKLTAAATVTATRGADYLESQLPAGTAAPTMLQPSRSYTPSDLQIREYAQKWSAVANPLSVVDDLRRGTVTHAQIDAIKNVYPELYTEIRVKTLEKIRAVDQSGKRLPLNDRLTLDLFLDLGGAGEPTLAGPFVDRLTAAQASQQQAQGSPPRSNAQLDKIGKSRVSGAQAAIGERI